MKTEPVSHLIDSLNKDMSQYEAHTKNLIQFCLMIVLMNGWVKLSCMVFMTFNYIDRTGNNYLGITFHINRKILVTAKLSLVEVSACESAYQHSQQQIDGKFLWWCYLITSNVLQNENPSQFFHLLNKLDWLNGLLYQKERGSGHHCTWPTICSNTLFITNSHPHIKKTEYDSISEWAEEKCFISPKMGEFILSFCKVRELKTTKRRHEGPCR